VVFARSWTAGRAAQRDHGHELEGGRVQPEGIEDLAGTVYDLAQPDPAQAQAVDGQEHVLDAGAGALVVLHGVVHRVAGQQDHDQGPGVPDDAAVLGQFGQLPLAGVGPGHDEEAPGLVVQAAGGPGAGLEDPHNLLPADGLVGEAPNAAATENGIEKVHNFITPASGNFC
jgi:hypothetical protein